MLARIFALALACVGPLILLAILVVRNSPSHVVNSDPDASLQASAPTMGADIPEATPVSLERSAQRDSNSVRLIDVSQRQFDRLVSTGLVLVKFGADWCGPCRRVVPELEQLASANAGDLTVLTVDVDREMRLAERHDVGPIPKMILFRDGEPIDDWTGFSPANRMQTIIDRARKSAPQGEILSNPFAI